MNVYNDEELSRINKVKETNDKLEEFFNGKRTEWKNQIEPLFEVLKVEIDQDEALAKVFIIPSERPKAVGK